MNEKNKSEQKRYSKDEVLQVTITDIGNDGEGMKGKGKGEDCSRRGLED